MPLVPHNDRVRGLVLGAAYGDSLGARYEGLHLRLSPDHVSLGRGVLFWRQPGWWTDDTDMSLAILLALRDTDPTDSASFRRAVLDNWLRWFTGASRVDMGVWTVRVLRRISHIDNPTPANAVGVAGLLRSRPRQGGGNAAVMRTAALALGFQGRPSECYDEACFLASMTHPDELAQQAAGIWAVLCERALSTGELDIAPALALAPSHWQERFAKSGPPRTNGSSGWAVATVLDAWWCVTTALDKLDKGPCLALAVRLGVARSGDPDTVAALVGALAGALSGPSEIPPHDRPLLHGGRWTGHTWTYDSLEELASTLAFRYPGVA